jgi:hypothetical protein
MLRFLAIFMSISLLLFQSSSLSACCQTTDNAPEPNNTSAITNLLGSSQRSGSLERSDVHTVSPGTAIAASDTGSSSSQQSNDNSKRKKIFAMILLMCLTATAIAVPVAVGVACHNHHHHHHHANPDQGVVFYNLLRTRQLQWNPAPLPPPPVFHPVIIKPN